MVIGSWPWCDFVIGTNNVECVYFNHTLSGMIYCYQNDDNCVVPEKLCCSRPGFTSS